MAAILTAHEFQPSAVPKDGCYDLFDHVQLPHVLFQPSAVPKDGCYAGGRGVVDPIVKTRKPVPLR